MIKRLLARAKSFRHKEEGAVVVEAVIIMPLLFGVVILMTVFFDAFRNQAVNLKANYTIADAISREDGYVTDTYINNAWRMHRFLTSSPNLTRLRISVVRYDEDEDTHVVVWSQAKGGGSNLTNKALDEINLTANDIPAMPDGEILIIVQTGVDYVPAFPVGEGILAFENMTFTRPRWSPRNLCYSSNGTASQAICPAHS